METMQVDEFNEKLHPIAEAAIRIERKEAGRLRSHAYSVTFPDGAVHILFSPLDHSMTPDEEDNSILLFAKKMWRGGVNERSGQSAYE